MKLFLFPLALLMLLCFFNSCQKEPNGGIPFYMKMDSVILTTNYSTQGDNTQSIEDVWVQTSTTNLGAYELPCNFPVLQQGNVSFLVSAGIWESGQSEMPVIYPFYQVDTFTLLNAVPGKKYSYIPHFTYKTSAVFAMNPPTEDFENSNDYDSMATLCHDTNVRYGHCCGLITVTSIDSDIVATQVASKAFLLNTGQEDWVELDYKCTVPFWVGLNCNFLTQPTDQQAVILIVPKPYWSKIYVSLTDIAEQEQADSYNLYFEAINPTGTNGGSVYIDDIKVVHF